MSLFNTSLNTSNTFGGTTTTTSNPMKDFEVVSPPEDSVSALEFSPATLQQNYLIAGSWDSNVSYCHNKRKKFCSFAKLTLFC